MEAMAMNPTVRQNENVNQGDDEDTNQGSECRSPFAHLTVGGQIL